MKSLYLRRGIAILLASCQIMLSCVVVGLTPAYAQTLDTEPPKVGIDTVTEASRNDSQVFTITATDNQSIAFIHLHYRLSPNANYQKGTMTRVGETDLYSFTIPAASLSSAVDSVQYYIEAKDDAGNRTLQGFSFDPLERTLLDSPATLASSNAQADASSTSLLGSLSTTQKVVIGVVGLVVVGALVSAAGGSSDDGGTGVPTVPVTIISQPLNASQ